MSEAERLDPKPVLAGLKDFQRSTVNRVFRRLYEDEPPARRFLVADEVGLGKTLVARGVIARSIERLQSQGVDRIDIVYICSNADIARQNVNRLNVTGRQEFNFPTRITMLPLHLRQLKKHGINFVSFTPGTSFNLKSRDGMLPERALLFRLLSYAWDWPARRHMGFFKVLRGGATLNSLRNSIGWTPATIGNGENEIDPGLANAFRQELRKEAREAHGRGELSLHERFDDLAEKYRRAKNDIDSNGRQQLVGDLRIALARSCVNALEPDLVILDEFQRFRDLLDGEDPAADLAQHLFEQETARVLLLSATPYKMYTLPEEAEANEDHYADFVRTARFLMGGEEASKFEKELQSFRHTLLDLETVDLQTIRHQRGRVERRLRKVMSRTERLAVKGDRNGMLAEKEAGGMLLTAKDLSTFVTSSAVSKLVGADDLLEYWKSAPYLLNFMDGYKLKTSFRDAITRPKTRKDLAQILAAGDGLLSVQKVEAYHEVDPGNARLRSLIHDCLDNESWRLLWLPPCLPYYELGTPFNGTGHARFTKRLVFSAWWVVPQIIASLVSYEAERRMMREGGGNRRNTPEARKRARPLLRFQRQGPRIAGMAALSLLYPSPTLAKLADPLRLAFEIGSGEGPAPVEAVAALAADKIGRAIRAVVPKGISTEGPVDLRWYWAAPLLLDAQNADLRSVEWLSRRQISSVWSAEAESDDSALGDAIDLALQVTADPTSLGRVPEDLIPVVTRQALAGPATCALRALARVAGGIGLVGDSDLRDGAAKISWGFRSLFNTPEVMAMLRGPRAEEDAYWQKVLDYCLNGCLQSVLDEYAHVLREWLGILALDTAVIGTELAQTMYDALTVRAVNYRLDDIRPGGEDGLEVAPKNMRARFALRFGSQSAEEDGQLQRSGQVRAAFNSPFWPFVLATTSVGQEGLDFHLYCHAVVHWNLPANPVDLEQREGRVHRYKGHAIRKNVAETNRAAGFTRRSADPWEGLFAAAKVGRSRDEGDLVPYWVYAPTEESARIERYVPSLPLSREIEKLVQLKRSLAVYRLAFGQPRQDDLAAYLSGLSEQRRLAVADELRVDLSP